MKAKAVRLHGANDLRLDEFELPEIKEDEILVKVVSDSVCMSTYKCAILGVNHKRVHEDVADHPAIMGHEMAGDIVKVGAKHQDKFKPGMKFTLQPALNYKGTCGHLVILMNFLVEIQLTALFQMKLWELMLT